MTAERVRMATGLRHAQRRAVYTDELFRAKVRAAAETGLFTRRELAQILGVSATTIQRWVAEEES